MLKQRNSRFAKLMHWLTNEMLYHYPEGKNHILSSAGYKYLQEVENNE